MSYNEAKLAEWKRLHGKVFALTADDLALAVRKPSRDDFGMFARQAGKNPAMAAHNLVISCLLDPEPAAVARVLDDKPGLAMMLGNKLLELSGVSAEVVMGEL
jgi:glucan biosynthesis protein